MKDDKNSSLSKLNDEFDSDLQSWYQHQDQEVPSAELDDAIIKMAKEASAEKTQSITDIDQQSASATGDKSSDNVIRVENSFWRKNRWALSSAASVMLVVTVVLLNPQSPQEILSDDAMPMMMQMSEPVDANIESTQNIDSISLQEQSLGVNKAPQQVQMTPRVMSVSDANLEGQAETKMKQAGEMYQANDSARLGAHAPTSKSVPQREAVVSAKQVLNHLEQLIDSQQWQEAETLANKVAKQYPQLEELNHPQHQRWRELRLAVTEH